MTIPGLRFALMMGAFLLWGFRDALWGALAVQGLYHFDPAMWWWGQSLPRLSYSFYVSVACLGFLVLHWNKYDMADVLKSPPVVLMIGIWFCLILRFDPANPRLHQFVWDKNLKSIAIMIVVAATVRTPARFRLFVWMLIIGSAGWGIEAWRNPRRQSGRLYGVGSVDADLDNFLAAHWALCVPFVIHFVLRGKKWERNIALVCGVFILNGIILTSSRGGFLSLVVGSGVYMLFTLREQPKLRMTALALAVAGLFVFVSMVDQVFLDRISTIWEGDKVDEYAGERALTGAGRTEIWAGGLRLIADHPFGLGGEGFESSSGPYLPEGRNRAAHNTYLKVAADYGIHGFVLFIWLLVVMVRNASKSWRAGRENEKLGSWSGVPLAFMSTMAAYMMTAMIANRFSYELFFWLAALASAIPACSAYAGRNSETEEGRMLLDPDHEEVSGIATKRVIMAAAISLAMLL